ncbi:hypothetical protein BD309DRAFT_953831 [Dichomitus squalens]|nr:hypothetical protein BD309DRAFT_953831 [Dichomitus squalens]
MRPIRDSSFIQARCAARTTTQATAIPLWQWHSGIPKGSTMTMRPIIRAGRCPSDPSRGTQTVRFWMLRHMARGDTLMARPTGARSMERRLPSRASQDGSRSPPCSNSSRHRGQTACCIHGIPFACRALRQLPECRTAGLENPVSNAHP